MSEYLNTAQVLGELATKSGNGNTPLSYDKLSESQKVAIRTALGDNWIAFGEPTCYGRFTIELLGDVSERLIAVMECLPKMSQTRTYN